MSNKGMQLTNKAITPTKMMASRLKAIMLKKKGSCKK